MTGEELKALREGIALTQEQMADELAMPLMKYKAAEGSYQVDFITACWAIYVQRKKIGGAEEWVTAPLVMLIRIVDAMKKPRGRPRKIKQPAEGFAP